MRITAKITGIEYKNRLTSNLKEFDLANFDINLLQIGRASCRERV